MHAVVLRRTNIVALADIGCRDLFLDSFWTCLVLGARYCGGAGAMWYSEGDTAVDMGLGGRGEEGLGSLSKVAGMMRINSPLINDFLFG